MTGDDPITTGKIALAHLKEFPDYYTRLERMEAEAEREQEAGGGSSVRRADGSTVAQEALTVARFLGTIRRRPGTG